jgi:hypothetical protein
MFVTINHMKDNWLLDYKKNVTSQFGEDGIIEKIFDILGVSVGWCVDVGAYGMRNSNTYSLIKRGWKGFLIESDPKYAHRLKKMYMREGVSERVFIKQVFVGPNDLDQLLSESPVPERFDFLSVDIDGNDYHVWKPFTKYVPSVVVIEINPVCKLGKYVQPIDGQGGSSFSSLVELGIEKGYKLISATEGNAFFVLNNLYNKFGINNNSPERLFVDCHHSYGKDTKNYAKT